MSSLAIRLVAEANLKLEQHVEISSLLIGAFPQCADVFQTHSFWGSPPEYRLLLEDSSGKLVAHLGFGLRTIGVSEQDVLIAGIGAVATHPRVQGQGLGRHLLWHLHRHLLEDFGVDLGYLGCREAVVGFYQKAGFTRTDQTVRELNPDTELWQESRYPNMILPVCKPLEFWPQTGRVDLRGMPW